MSSATFTGDNLVDLLASRRKGNDLIWVMSHNYNSNCYQRSLKRSPYEIRQSVWKDPVLQESIRGNSDLRQRIEKILDEMCHTFSLRRARFVAFMALGVLKSVYQHIWLFDSLPIARDSFYYTTDSMGLHESLQKMITQSPVLYLPTHRSYADFVLLSYLCFQMNLPLPTIAAGNDFLSLNQVSSLLRSCGAFFIRRSFKDSADPIYPQVFRSYVQQLILGGEMPLECFIEGTRSRSGKSLWPKLGLLRTALHLLWSSRIPDLIILPISICYDRILEEDLYAKELSPLQVNSSDGRKPKETTSHLISGARAIMAQNYGSVYVRFGQPISVRELEDSREIRKQFSKLPQSVLPSPSKEEMIFMEDLARKVIKTQHDSCVISSFSLFSIIVSSEMFRRFNYEEYCNFNSDLDFSFETALTVMDYLTQTLRPYNCAHILRGQTLQEDFLQSLPIYQNIVTLAEKNILRVSAKSLVLTKLRVYSNQFLQLVAETAMILYSTDYDFYQKLQDLLRFEFVLDSVDVQLFESVKAKLSNLAEEVKDVFTSQIDFLIVNYSRILRWFMTRNTIPTKARQIIDQIQSNLKIPMDLVQNFIQLAITCRAMIKNSDCLCTINPENLQSLSNLIHSIINERTILQSYCLAKPKL